MYGYETDASVTVSVLRRCDDG